MAVNTYLRESTPIDPTNPTVEIKTSKGTIKVELFRSQAPISVSNFLAYVKDKHYDGTIFHRVINGFMIQGGGFLPGMQKKFSPRGPIKNEAFNGLSNKRGTLAMARTNDPDSATDQFFINVVDNAKGLDPRPGSAGYAVFGRVIDGMKVVDAIKEVPTTTKQAYQNVPVDDVIIESIRLLPENTEKQEDGKKAGD
ncbi:MAG: peptidylprolyl isomerase [Gemmataceae bacterium]